MRKLLLIIPTLLIFSLLNPFLAFAQHTSQGESVVVHEDETIDQDYFATGETITISGTINGDVYLAGGTIYIDGTINGDLIAAGGTITIRGQITEDIRVMGGTVTVSGDVGENITVAAGTTLITENATVGGSLVIGTGTLEVFAPIGRGMTFAAGTATLGSTVNGNILAGVGSLTLTNDASIDGDLVYYADLDSDAQISQSATVSGTITHNVHVEKSRGLQHDTSAFVAGLGFFFKMMSLLSSLLVGLLLIFFTPNIAKQTTQKLADNWLISLVMGIVFYLLAPIIILLLLISLIGIPLTLLFIPLILFMMFFAKIFVAIYIGQRVLSYLKQKQSLAWTFFIGLVIYGILTSIPVFGWFLSLLALFGGTGAFLLEKKDLYRSLRSKKVL